MATLYSVRRVAEMLEVTPETVRRWLRAGRIPGVKLTPGPRSGWRLTRADVEALTGGPIDEVPRPGQGGRP